jgi:hypothetical protein
VDCGAGQESGGRGHDAMVDFVVISLSAAGAAVPGVGCPWVPCNSFSGRTLPLFS